MTSESKNSFHSYYFFAMCTACDVFGKGCRCCWWWWCRFIVNSCTIFYCLGLRQSGTIKLHLSKCDVVFANNSFSYWNHRFVLFSNMWKRLIHTILKQTINGWPTKIIGIFIFGRRHEIISICIYLYIYNSCLDDINVCRCRLRK